MKKTILVLLGATLFVLAQLNVAAACGMSWHEPEVPEVLR